MISLLTALALMTTSPAPKACRAEIVVLGTAQDGGAPQLGHDEDPAWKDPALRRTATSIALVERDEAGTVTHRWLIEATPDLREQLYRLDRVAPPTSRANAGLDGVFLTHAHMGHYTGLMFFGHEVIGAKGLKTWAMPRMSQYLSANGPWSQLVAYDNIALQPLVPEAAVKLGAFSVTPIVVPHRQEYSEVVGFRIEGPGKKALFIPDIDRWEDWDKASGVAGKIEAELKGVDRAYLDGTFWNDGELPGRDMSKIPHPMIRTSLDRFKGLARGEREKVRFIHLNWSNPARFAGTEARKAIEAEGMGVAQENERWCL